MEFNSVRFVLNRRSKVRYEKLEGVECMVVPTTMMVEGVHEGNKGKLYYSEKRLATNVSAWDHKPAVVYHPMSGGKYISACTPEVLNTSKAGILLNSRYKGKQQTDVYLNVKRTEEIDNRVVEMLRNEQPINVSTGMYYNVVGGPGVWNGEEYDAEVGDFAPDHLAILPDVDGACSISDGAGMLVNEDLPRVVMAKGQKDIEAHVKAIQQLVLNELSADQLFSSLLRAVRATIEKFGASWDGWIQDVYPKYFIYTANGASFKQAYKSSNNSVELVGSPTQVVRVYSYETVDGYAVNTTKTKGNDMMTPEQKAAAVNGLIATGGWTETQRSFLLSCDETQLGSIVANNKTAAASPAVPAQNSQTQPTQTANGQIQMFLPTPVPQPAPQIVANGNVQSQLQGVPEDLRQMFTEMMAEREARKAELVANISNTPGNVFTKEWLQTRPYQELQGIAALAAARQPVQSFVGNAFGGNLGQQLPQMFQQGQQMTGGMAVNAAAAEEILALP